MQAKTYTLTLDEQELRDLIEAALVCECQNAKIARGMQRKGLELDARKLVRMNARLMRVTKRMQETEGEGTKKMLLTTAEWLYLKWMIEKAMIRMNGDELFLNGRALTCEASREAIGRELENIAQERKNAKRILAKIEAAETAPDETEEKK